MNAVEAKRRIERLVRNRFPRAQVRFSEADGFRGITFTVLGADGSPKTQAIRIAARHYGLINKAWILRRMAAAPGRRGRLV